MTKSKKIAYIEKEIEELDKQHKTIQGKQFLWLLGVLFGLVFFPISIGCLIVMIINGSKMSKIRKEIAEKKRMIDMLNLED